MSNYSPHPIINDELITRFVFLKDHLRSDKKSIKPNFFSHIDSRGCSIQRETIAGDNELISFVKNFLANYPEKNWFGVVSGKCHELRSILTDKNKRACCVFDTGEVNNPSHGEICKTHYIIEEAERLELRRKLIKIFNNGLIVNPNEYRDSKIASRI